MKCGLTERPFRRGLTIVELVCVVAVVTLLMGLVAPAIGRTRESCRRMQCAAHLREVGLALVQKSESTQRLPCGWELDPSGRTAFGWASTLLPWLDQPGAAAVIRRDQPVDSGAHLGLMRPLPVCLCPSDPVEAMFAVFAEEDVDHEGFGQASSTVLGWLPAASYVGVYGTHDPDDRSGIPGEGAFVCGRAVQLTEFERGLSVTMWVSERTARKLPSTWIGIPVDGEDAAARVVGYADEGPNREDSDECELDSRHPGLINVLWGDGRVEAVRDGIDSRIYRESARRRFPSATAEGF